MHIASSRPPLLSSCVSHAVWSIGEHGPTSELVVRLRPLLHKYRVSAYLCGHDHSMQHLREVNTTLDYFVVGAGHKTDPSQVHKVKQLARTSLPHTHLAPPPILTWPLHPYSPGPSTHINLAPPPILTWPLPPYSPDPSTHTDLAPRPILTWPLAPYSPGPSPLLT